MATMETMRGTVKRLMTEVHTTPDPVEVKKLAKAFSAQVRRELKPDELKAAVAANKGEKPGNGADHIHDYMDANMTMLRAAKASLGRKIDLISGDMDLVNAAWEMARKSGYRESLGEAADEMAAFKKFEALFQKAEASLDDALADLSDAVDATRGAYPNLKKLGDLAAHAREAMDRELKKLALDAGHLKANVWRDIEKGA